LKHIENFKWSAIIRLPVGTHEYKFLADGLSVLDPMQKAVKNTANHENHVVTVLSASDTDFVQAKPHMTEAQIEKITHTLVRGSTRFGEFTGMVLNVLSAGCIQFLFTLHSFQDKDGNPHEGFPYSNDFIAKFGRLHNFKSVEVKPSQSKVTLELTIERFNYTTKLFELLLKSVISLNDIHFVQGEMDAIILFDLMNRNYEQLSPVTPAFGLPLETTTVYLFGFGSKSDFQDYQFFVTNGQVQAVSSTGNTFSFSSCSGCGFSGGEVTCLGSEAVTGYCGGSDEDAFGVRIGAYAYSLFTLLQKFHQFTTDLNKNLVATTKKSKLI